MFFKYNRTKKIKTWIYGWKQVFLSVIGRTGVPFWKIMFFSGHRTGLMGTGTATGTSSRYQRGAVAFLCHISVHTMVHSVKSRLRLLCERVRWVHSCGPDTEIRVALRYIQKISISDNMTAGPWLFHRRWNPEVLSFPMMYDTWGLWQLWKLVITCHCT